MKINPHTPLSPHQTKTSSLQKESGTKPSYINFPSQLLAAFATKTEKIFSGLFSKKATVLPIPHETPTAPLTSAFLLNPIAVTSADNLGFILALPRNFQTLQLKMMEAFCQTIALDPSQRTELLSILCKLSAADRTKLKTIHPELYLLSRLCLSSSFLKQEKNIQHSILKYFIDKNYTRMLESLVSHAQTQLTDDFLQQFFKEENQEPKARINPMFLLESLANGNSTLFKSLFTHQLISANYTPEFHQNHYEDHFEQDLEKQPADEILRKLIIYDALDFSTTYLRANEMHEPPSQTLTQLAKKDPSRSYLLFALVNSDLAEYDSDDTISDIMDTIQQIARTPNIELNIQNAAGNTPLMHTIIQGNTNARQILLKTEGHDLSITNKKGNTAAEMLQNH